MSTYGNIVRCPACGAEHAIRVGEIANQRRIEFTCTSCAADVVLENEAQEPVIHKKGRWDS